MLALPDAVSLSSFPLSLLFSSFFSSFFSTSFSFAYRWLVTHCRRRRSLPLALPSRRAVPPAPLARNKSRRRHRHTYTTLRIRETNPWPGPSLLCRRIARCSLLSHRHRTPQGAARKRRPRTLRSQIRRWRLLPPTLTDRRHIGGCSPVWREIRLPGSGRN